MVVNSPPWAPHYESLLPFSNHYCSVLGLWFLGQKFFRVTQAIAAELSDWFQDPEYLSDWLVSQQEHMVLEQPLVLPL